MNTPCHSCITSGPGRTGQAQARLRFYLNVGGEKENGEKTQAPHYVPGWHCVNRQVNRFSRFMSHGGAAAGVRDDDGDVVPAFHGWMSGVAVCLALPMSVSLGCPWGAHERL